jgi:dihydrodipicolinate synthase/N-acetylneuraminate lyase
MAVAKRIRGIIGACLTPFGKDDRVDYKALEREIEFLVPDCDAITVAAVEAAEYTMLSRDERKELLRVATEMIGKRVPVILGCSSPAPREVIELAEYAATVGGDFVQVLMPLRPWGGQPTIAELMEFYTQVAAGSPLPVTCYHNPGPGADRRRTLSSKSARSTIFVTSRKAPEILLKFLDSLNKSNLPAAAIISRRCSRCWLPSCLADPAQQCHPRARGSARRLSGRFTPVIWRLRVFGPAATHSFQVSGRPTACRR